MTMPQPDDALYFAYGSNLNRADWEGFCARNGCHPDRLQPVARAILPDMRLSFDYHSMTRGGGALNIQPALGHSIYGVLYRADAEGWKALDAKEGAPYCYQRVARIALAEDGSRVPVVTYEVTPESLCDFTPPTAEYRLIVAQGLTAWGLPTTALERASRNQSPLPAIDTLFVYGTLMAGESRATAIPPKRILSRIPALTPGTLHATAGDYPAMRLPDPDAGPAPGRVRGECLQLVDLPCLLPDLDRIEGFGGYDHPRALFHRTLVPVKREDGRDCRAWCYVAGDAVRPGAVIPGGYWRHHRQDPDRPG